MYPLSLPGRLTDPGNFLVSKNCIDQARLAHVGAAHKGELGSLVTRKVVGFVCGSMETDCSDVQITGRNVPVAVCWIREMKAVGRLLPILSHSCQIIRGSINESWCRRRPRS